MRIIINCDDLGASAVVNDSIFALMEEWRVTSATLLMNGPEIDDAIRRIRHNPRGSFGIHLNGTEYRPLTKHPGLRPLLNEDGEFAGNLRGIPLTPAIQQGLLAEWSAQIQLGIDCGVRISHLDSHHHVHTEPRLFPVLKALQKKFGISKVRLTRNAYSLGEKVSAKMRVSKMAWNFMLRHYVATRTTDRFLAFINFHEHLCAGHRWRTRSAELMCHAGGKGFAKETELLWGNWKDELAPDAQLISYNEL